MEVVYMYSLFIGIDVSKDSFSAGGLDDKAKLLFSLAPLMNAQGFSEFLKVLKAHQKDLSSVIVALINRTISPELVLIPRIKGHNYDCY
jgi:hypothetical protein